MRLATIVAFVSCMFFTPPADARNPVAAKTVKTKATPKKKPVNKKPVRAKVTKRTEPEKKPAREEEPAPRIEAPVVKPQGAAVPQATDNEEPTARPKKKA